MAKALTRDQLQSRKEKAVRFVFNVLNDSERAEEIEDESLEDYATRRKIEIVGNPSGGKMSRIKAFNPRPMLNPQRQVKEKNPQAGRSELLARIRELQQENDQLQDTLDKVADLAAAPEDERDEDQDELVDKLNDIIDTVSALDEGDHGKHDTEEDDAGEE